MQELAHHPPFVYSYDWYRVRKNLLNTYLVSLLGYRVKTALIVGNLTPFFSNNGGALLGTFLTLWHLRHRLRELFHDGCDYNAIENFNAIKIIKRKAISNTLPDTISE